jgi:hypothetical protein
MARKQGIKPLAVALGVITPLPMFFLIAIATNRNETGPLIAIGVFEVHPWAETQR